MPLTSSLRQVRRLRADCQFTDVIYTTPTEIFRGDLLTLTGGGATALDSLPTSLLPRPYVVKVSFADDKQEWKLRARAGGDPLPASGDPLLGTAFVYPADYNAGTNDVLWVRIN
jgi:hypothetical protein